MNRIVACSSFGRALLALLLGLGPGTALADADLSVQLQITPDPVAPGATLTQQVTVTNLGPDAATGVELIIDRPGVPPPSGVIPFAGGTTILTAPAAAGWTCDLLPPAGIVAPPGLGFYLCRTPTLAVGSTSFIVTSTVRTGIVGPIGASAEIRGTSVDSVTGNNSTGRVEVVLGFPPTQTIPSHSAPMLAALLVLLLATGAVLLAGPRSP